MVRQQLLLPLVLIFSGAILGQAMSAVLIYEHQGQKTSIGATICSGETDTCATARESAIAGIFGILPLPTFGFLFYSGIFALAVTTLLVFHNLPLNLLLYASIGGLLFDIFLLLYSIFFLQGICKLCAITYVATVILLIGVVIIRKRGDKIMKSDSLSIKGIAGGLTSFAVFFALAIFFQTSAKAEPPGVDVAQTKREKELLIQLQNELYKQWKESPRLNLDVPAAASKGAKNPVLVIQEFADALCPHCRDMGQKLAEFSKKHPDHVRVIFRHYPLDMTCNSAMKRAFHAGSCDLARAMECGDQQGKFWNMHDSIFNAQENFMRNPVSDKAIESLAESAQVDKSRLMQCYVSKSTMAKVKNDIAAANKFQISGTPTLIVNDRRLPGVPGDYIISVLEKLLSEEMVRK